MRFREGDYSPFYSLLLGRRILRRPWPILLSGRWIIAAADFVFLDHPRRWSCLDASWLWASGAGFCSSIQGLELVVQVDRWIKLLGRTWVCDGGVHQVMEEDEKTLHDLELRAVFSLEFSP